MPTVLLDPMTAPELAALLRSVKALQHAAASGHGRILLRGKNIGLLSETPDDAGATLFIRAAQELGAQVALIRPSHAGLLRPDSAPATMRMLGRLYDAIECQGLPADLLEQLRSQCSVPVMDSQRGLADHQATWGQAMQSLGVQDSALLLTQALLMHSLTA